MNIFFIMSIEYLNFYNNLIRLTTNKNLYKGLKSQDSFSDRLILFLIHFAFFLKVFKKKENTKILQEIYDFNFRQMELTIREIGYGDQSINKKMKEYINFFHFILLEIRLWDDLTRTGMRRAKNMKFSSKNVIEDKKSGEYRLSHHLDLKTGMYKGRQVLDPKD